MNVRGFGVLLAVLLALTLLIGARNIGFGVDSTPFPFIGLAVVTAGLAIWFVSLRLAKPLAWYKTLVTTTYFALVILVVAAFVRAYDDFGGLSDPSLGDPSRIELHMTMVFSIGFGVLSFLFLCAVTLFMRPSTKRKSESRDTISS